MPRVLLATDLPSAAKVLRTVLHWTAGQLAPNAIDVMHYHFLVAGKPAVEIVRGKFGLTAVNPPLVEGHYAAHTHHLNSNSAAVSICGMSGSVAPRTAGPYPFSEEQFETAVRAVADIHDAYGLPATPQTALMHSTVEPVLGVHQAGKWDVDLLPFKPDMKAADVHEYYLQRLRDVLAPGRRGQFDVVWDGHKVAKGFYDNGDAQVPLRDLSGPLGFKILKADGKTAVLSKGLFNNRSIPMIVVDGKGYVDVLALVGLLGMSAEYIVSLGVYRLTPA